MRALQSVHRSVEVIPPYNISIQRQDPPLRPCLVRPLLCGCRARKAVCSFGFTIFGRRRSGHSSGGQALSEPDHHPDGILFGPHLIAKPDSDSEWGSRSKKVSSKTANSESPSEVAGRFCSQACSNVTLTDSSFTVAYFALF